MSFIGGLGLIMSNLMVVKKKVDSGVFDPTEVLADESVEQVVSAWEIVKKKGKRFTASSLVHLSSHLLTYSTRV